MHNIIMHRSESKLDKLSKQRIRQAKTVYGREIHAVTLGQILATSAALDILGERKIAELLIRHENRDYGDICNDDICANELALYNDAQIVSRYNVNNEKVFVITEGDRSSTTVLMTYEY